MVFVFFYWIYFTKCEFCVASGWLQMVYFIFRPNLQNMDVLRPGVQLDQQLLAYDSQSNKGYKLRQTAQHLRAIPDPEHNEQGQRSKLKLHESQLEFFQLHQHRNATKDIFFFFLFFLYMVSRIPWGICATFSKSIHLSMDNQLLSMISYCEQCCQE